MSDLPKNNRIMLVFQENTELQKMRKDLEKEKKKK